MEIFRQTIWARWKRECKLGSSRRTGIKFSQKLGIDCFLTGDVFVPGLRSVTVPGRRLVHSGHF